MAHKTKHKFASAKADGGDATLVRPQANWNDTHQEGEELTNRTGAALAVGDVVALSTANDESVVLLDTAGSLRDFVVSLEAPADLALGFFGQAGTFTVKNQGAVTRGNYLQKSATSKAVEDMGTAVTSKAPKAAVGFALMGNVGSGTVVAYLFGHTVQPDLDDTQQTRNLLRNGDFEVWKGGASVAPTFWTVVGGGASAARDGTNFKVGAFAASLTRVTNDCQLEQDAITQAGGQAYIRGRAYKFGAWVRATVASRVRLRINDGVGSSFSGYHTGGGAYELLVASRTLDSLATALKAGLQIDTGDTTAQIDGAVLTEGDRQVMFARNPEDGARGDGTLDTGLVEVGGVLDRDVTLATVANTAVETSVYSTTIRAGVLGTNRKVRLSMIGEYRNFSGATKNLTCRLKYGATTVATLTVANGDDANRHSVLYDAELTAKGATNAQGARARLTIGLAVAGADSVVSLDHVTVHTAVAEDSAADKVLDLTVQHSAADPNTFLEVHAVHAELL